MKSTSRLLLALLAVFALGAALAPAASAEPTDDESTLEAPSIVYRDGWILKLDPASTRALASDPAIELSEIAVDLAWEAPDPVFNAAQDFWFSTLVAEWAVEESPRACVSIEVADNGVGTAGNIYSQCPWQVPSLQRGKVMTFEDSGEYGWA